MDTRLATARSTVNRYSLYAGLTGLVPVPAVDAASVVATQLLMLKALARQYGVPFRRDLASSLVASLGSGVVATELAYGGGSALLRSVPLVGWTLSAVTMPMFAAALTYAVGRVFLVHFEAGGTLFDLDPEKMRAYFQGEMTRARAPQVPATAAA